jgi:hypothetical protein
MRGSERSISAATDVGTALVGQARDGVEERIDQLGQADEPIGLEPEGGTAASVRIDVGRGANRVELRVKGPAVASAIGALLAVVILWRGAPQSNPAHFVLALIACAVVGGTLSLLAMNWQLCLLERVTNGQIDHLNQYVARLEGERELLLKRLLDGSTKHRR